eukprot:snap_masked-scaffold_30-processed-gene-3.64-mRNA-1 protein AED:1.00 eAED:1.00 QI:0/0/0/0/1/1/2/0/134
MTENENSNDVKRGLQELNHNKPKVIISDGSPALCKVAKSCGTKHIHCLKHLAVTFSQAAKGSDLVEFMEELAEIITDSFPNLRALDNSFKEILEKFTEPAQQKYLKSLEKDKKSISWSHTIEFLTFTHGVTQRV